MTSLLQKWVTLQADRVPDQIAVALEGDRITYGQLEADSNRPARLLREAGCRRGDRVAVLSRKTPRAIVAVVGIYKADCTFVPLDYEKVWLHRGEARDPSLFFSD